MSDEPMNPRVAERLTRAAQAAQALSETLWEALHEELSDPRSQRVVELSERLADIPMTVASLARMDARPPASAAASPADTAGGASGGPVAPKPPVVPRDPRSGDPGSRTAPVTYGEPSAPREPPLPREPFATREPRSAAVLVDELAPAAPVQSAPEIETDGPAAEMRLRIDDRPWVLAPEIEIRDVRGEEGPAAWIGSIGRRLERHEQDGAPFAVLLVELVDTERLRHAEPAGEVSRLMSQVEEALARELRPADSLTRERPGRYWLLAPQTDGTAARMLAERLARSIRSTASHRGRPLELAVGIAVCPEDGRQASALAAHADVGLYAAQAAGRPSIG
jgi:GGDEF domain-containing protein